MAHSDEVSMLRVTDHGAHHTLEDDRKRKCYSSASSSATPFPVFDRWGVSMGIATSMLLQSMCNVVHINLAV